MAKEGKEKKGGKLKIILIVVAVIVVIGVIGSMGDGNDATTSQTDQAKQTETEPIITEESTENTESQAESETTSTETKSVETEIQTEAVETEPTATTYDGGMYKVGTDLPAGEYLIETDTMGYMQVASDSTGELDSIITNSTYNNRMYVTVSDGQYLTFDGKATPTAEAPAYQAENGYYPEGQYLVGKDIPAGEYKISVMDGNVAGYGYIEVATDSLGTIDSIVTNSNIDSDAYQSVTDGQYLKLNGCEIKGQ